MEDNINRFNKINEMILKDPFIFNNKINDVHIKGC